MTKLNNLSGKSYLTSLILLRKSVIVYLSICIFVIVGTVTREQRKEGERINCWRNIRRGAVTGTNCSHVIHLTAKQRKTTKVLWEKNMIFLFTEIQKKCHQQFGRWTFPHLHSKFPLVAFILKFLSNGIPVKYKSTTRRNIIFKKNARERSYFLGKN